MAFGLLRELIDSFWIVLAPALPPSSKANHTQLSSNISKPKAKSSPTEQVQKERKLAAQKKEKRSRPNRSTVTRLEWDEWVAAAPKSALGSKLVGRCSAAAPRREKRLPTAAVGVPLACLPPAMLPRHGLAPLPVMQRAAASPSSPSSPAMQMAAAPSLKPHSELVATKTLVVREGYALDSAVVEPSVSQGQVVVILMTLELADGTYRALVRRPGLVVPMGWITSMHKAGSVLLLPRSDPQSAHLENELAKAKARAAAARASAIVAEKLSQAARTHKPYIGLEMPVELQPRGKAANAHGSLASSTASFMSSDVSSRSSSSVHCSPASPASPASRTSSLSYTGKGGPLPSESYETPDRMTRLGVPIPSLPGWLACTDPTHQRPFWFNTLTQETVWVDPRLRATPAPADTIWSGCDLADREQIVETDFGRPGWRRRWRRQDTASLAPRQIAAEPTPAATVPPTLAASLPVRPRAPSSSPPESAFKLAQALAEMRRSREGKERKSYA
eukprot:jgi/Chrpa1/1054/Chrysochromulina_OHIO_Genome00010577-RA